VLRLSRPARDAIDRWLTRCSTAPFSYEDVGATDDAERLSEIASGYRLDRQRVRIGTGRADYGRAVEAVRRWKMFDVGWAELCWPDAPIREGTTVAVMTRTLGVWSLHPSRVVYEFEESGDVERFGFAYGTLLGHSLRGEERFGVEWRRADDAVAYELLRFSRPSGVLATLLQPYARHLQRCFARDSLRAMSSITSP
jgi:uncharacterized protein (UPF0548 family)